MRAVQRRRGREPDLAQLQHPRRRRRSSRKRGHPGHQQRPVARSRSQNVEIRKNVLKYDDVLNRAAPGHLRGPPRVLRRRRPARPESRGMIEDAVNAYVEDAHPRRLPASDWDLDQLWTELQDASTRSVSPSTRSIEEAGGRGAHRPSKFGSPRGPRRTPRSAYERREETLGDGRHARAGAPVVLLGASTASGASTSTRWTTSRRASACGPSAQRDPLVEYQREGFAHVPLDDGRRSRRSRSASCSTWRSRCAGRARVRPRMRPRRGCAAVPSSRVWSTRRARRRAAAKIESAQRPRRR